MTAQEFAYWLQGFFEVTEAGDGGTVLITPAQAKMIREHLALVFKKDPSITRPAMPTGVPAPQWPAQPLRIDPIPGPFYPGPFEAKCSTLSVKSSTDSFSIC